MSNIVICELGRMGDIVASEPIFRVVHAKNPDRRLTWYTTEPFAEILKSAPFISDVRTVKTPEEYAEAKQHFSKDTICIELNYRDPSNSKTKGKKCAKQPREFESLLQQFATAAGISVDDETPQFHFDPDSEKNFRELNLPAKYAVFQCVSNGRSRQWGHHGFQRLADLLVSAGYIVVEIGFESKLRKCTEHIDLTGRRSLQTLARVIQHAELFVGVESGFGHIANAVGTFMIIISGRLRKYPEYVTYSGRARAGEGCNIVRFYGEESDRLPEKIAVPVLERFLAGNPMSGPECTQYCLKAQIQAMRADPLWRIGESLKAPFAKLVRAIRFHYRKKR